MDMNYFINLTKTYKFTDGRAQINYLHLPVNYVCLNRPFGVYADGISFGNDLVKHLTEFRMPNLVRTPSGGISTSKANLKPLTYAWDIEAKYVDLIVIVNNKGAIFTFGMDTMAPSRELGDDRTPFELYQRCMEIFGQFGIDVWKHKVSKKEGLRLVQEEIEGPKKELGPGVKTGIDAIYYHVHHIDFNSAWPACACAEFPDLRPAFQYMYDHRKTDLKENYKAVMNITLGYFMSKKKPVECQLAPITKAAHNGCNKLLRELALKLVKAGFIILLYNTDGIYYVSKDGKNRMYHDENEGAELGQWKHDHIDITWRAKNAVAYEFIENGEYTVIMSGTCNYEKNVKPRALWGWGDLFQEGTDVQQYGWCLEKGILKFITKEV